MSSVRDPLADHAVTRRAALQRAAWLLGAAISAPTIAGVMAGCDRAQHTTASAWTPRALSASRIATVIAMAETILPRTDTPGATDAGVVRFVDAMLADFYPSDVRARFLAGLDHVDARARRAFGQAFADGNAAQQLAVVNAMDAATFSTGVPSDPAAAAKNPATAQGTVQGGRGMPNDAEPDDVAIRSFYRTLKELTLVGYYTSQMGATEELRVAPLGPFQADVPYASLGHAWA